MPALAQLLAEHALLLLGAAILLMALAVVIVVALARCAARYADTLRQAVDLVLPGHGWRPRTHLVIHLALGLLLTSALVLFVVIAEDMLTGGRTVAFDLAFADALAGQTTPFWYAVFWCLTWLGSAPAVAAVAALVFWRLLASGQKLLAIMWAICHAGSGIVTYAMKVAFARPRPADASPLLYDGGWSFPSGHAMATMVLSGVGVYLVLRLGGTWRTRGLLIVLLLAWPLLIGFSRLYLGVHFVSDVMAGYVAGLAWIAVCVSASEVARSRSVRHDVQRAEPWGKRA